MVRSRCGAVCGLAALAAVSAACAGTSAQPRGGRTGYIITTSGGVPAAPPDPAVERRSFFGIRWAGSYRDNLRFARNLSYRTIEYQDGMEDDPAVSDVRFLVENPFYAVYIGLFGTDYVRAGQTYSAAQRQAMERFLAWKSTDPFPANLATGWFTGADFFPQPDFQQQAVIDTTVEAIVRYVGDRERPARGFLFAGMTWDVPQLTGDFWTGIAGQGGEQVTLAHWTGSDSSVLHEGITHEYATFSDGYAAFYKQLRRRLAEQFAGRPLTFMMEPYAPYHDWIQGVAGRADAAELMPDLLFQESRTLDFATDERIFATGLVTHDRMGCSTPDEHGLAGNESLAAAAATRGSWFTWYFRFGGTGDGIDYQNVYELPAWLQLVRVVPGWDNLAAVPLGERAWDGVAYRSPNSAMSPHLVASRNPYTGKIFAVFVDREGVLALRPGETVTSIERADAWFGPAGDGSADLEVRADGTIRPR
jgi:hypothetical protein